MHTETNDEYTTIKRLVGFLGYSNMNKALREHINEDQKKTLLGVIAKSPCIHSKTKIPITRWLRTKTRTVTELKISDPRTNFAQS